MNMIKKKFTVTFCLIFVFLVAGAQTLPNGKATTATLSTYQHIKILSKKDRAKAIDLAEKTLKERPYYYDVRVLLGYMYGWNKQYDKARNEFNYVLRKKPDYTDARVGLVTVETWDKNYQKAIQASDAGLKYSPDSPALKKQKALAQKRLYERTRKTTDHPTFRLRERKIVSEKGEAQNEFAAYYERSNFDDLDYNWELKKLEYKRKTPYGSIIFRVNNAKRFKQEGWQYEVDAYPKLGDGRYLYLNYGISSATFYPHTRFGGEIYQSLPQSFEASFGFRRLLYNSSNSTIWTGSLGKYIGNYWFSLRPYITPKEGSHFSRSLYLTARRYFGDDPDQYLSATGGVGSGPNPDDNDFGRVSGTNKRSIRLEAKFPLKKKLIYMKLKGKLSKEHFSNGNDRYEVTFGGGLECHF